MDLLRLEPMQLTQIIMQMDPFTVPSLNSAITASSNSEILMQNESTDRADIFCSEVEAKLLEIELDSEQLQHTYIELKEVLVSLAL